MNGKLETVKKRIKKDKELLLEQLKKTPIIQLACEKTAIGRTTYYRWRQEDRKFCALADAAISDGISLINDMAESQLLGSIRDGNMTGIIFWLKHHHRDYETRIEIRQKASELDDVLSKKQKKLARKALGLTLFNKKLNPYKEEKNE
jgi:hypothetical protein